MTCFVVPAAVILSAVLSPQYFIWALPLVGIMAMEVLPDPFLKPRSWCWHS